MVPISAVTRPNSSPNGMGPTERLKLCSSQRRPGGQSHRSHSNLSFHESLGPDTLCYSISDDAILCYGKYLTTLCHVVLSDQLQLRLSPPPLHPKWRTTTCCNALCRIEFCRRSSFEPNFVCIHVYMVVGYSITPYILIGFTILMLSLSWSHCRLYY